MLVASGNANGVFEPFPNIYKLQYVRTFNLGQLQASFLYPKSESDVLFTLNCTSQYDFAPHPILWAYGTLASLDPKGFPLKTRPLGVFSLDQSWQVRSSLSEAAHAERPHFGSPPKRPSLSPFKKKVYGTSRTMTLFPSFPVSKKRWKKTSRILPPSPHPQPPSLCSKL